MDLNSSGPEVITNAQRVARLWLRALVMKTTLLEHLSLGPYKESIASECRFSGFTQLDALRAAHMLLVVYSVK